MADSTITLRVVGDTAKAGGSAASAPQGSGNAPAAAPPRPRISIHAPREGSDLLGRHRGRRPA